MKQLLLISLCFPFMALGQKTYVPDDDFEQSLINLGLDNVLDDSVLTSAIDTVSELHLGFFISNIYDLTGVEDFNSLKDLTIWYQYLTTLDISQNIILESLNCTGNQLTSLDVSNNIALKSLVCAENQIASLDVSNNLSLNELDCGGNQLTILDVSQNPDLTLLDCGGDQITILDVSHNTVLTSLECAGNQLTFLDISNNTALTYLHCEYNQLTILDISNNTALTILNCDGNQLTTLNVSQNTSLVDLGCYQNQLTSLDVRDGNNINFIVFRVNQNQNLTCINVDDSTFSVNNWTNNIDPQHYFSNNCSIVPFDCTDSLEVTDVTIDNVNLTMNIAIYNGYNYFLNYPYVVCTIDANGDTIQAGNMNLFGAINFDTTWYNYSILNPILPTYPLTIYFVYSDGSLVTDTCILTYNSTPTVISDINLIRNIELIRIVDVLGREIKQTSQPLFYIYDDGKVEKRIIIE